jgi:hypothetical protein
VLKRIRQSNDFEKLSGHAMRHVLSGRLVGARKCAVDPQDDVG